MKANACFDWFQTRCNSFCKPFTKIIQLLRRISHKYVAIMSTNKTFSVTEKKRKPFYKFLNKRNKKSKSWDVKKKKPISNI